MANYLLNNYKGKYRLMTEINQDTNDFMHNITDNQIADNDIYIRCSYGNKIFYYGLNSSRRAVLEAYIPSIGRGHNICKELDKQKIEYFDLYESSEELGFKFMATDIDVVAKLLKAVTSGAKVNVFSTKNLPQRKDIEIPQKEINRYKKIIENIASMLIIANLNDEFLNQIEADKQKTDKEFNVRKDMRKQCMSRLTKEYIYTMGYWEEYLKFLKKNIK